MLVLTRKAGESLFVGDDIKFTIFKVKGSQVVVGIQAPSHVAIKRDNMKYDIIKEPENQTKEGISC